MPPTDAKKRLVTAIMDAITAAGELPESTLRDRVIVALAEARSHTDTLIGAGGTNRLSEAPMSSRMS